MTAGEGRAQAEVVTVEAGQRALEGEGMDQEVEAMAREAVVTGMAAAARELGEEATVQE